jgi:hypothetical protein
MWRALASFSGADTGSTLSAGRWDKTVMGPVATTSSYKVTKHALNGCMGSVADRQIPLKGSHPAPVNFWARPATKLRSNNHCQFSRAADRPPTTSVKLVLRDDRYGLRAIAVS